MEADKPEDVEIKFMTLNYSGILLSPFQFYSQELSPIQSMLSKIFQKCIQKRASKNIKQVKWNMGLIDKKIQKNRYSPLYNQHVGCDQQTSKLMTDQQFTQQWNRWYKQHQAEYDQLKASNDDLQNALTYDYVVYSAIVMYAYKVDSMQNVEVFDSKNYRQLMKKFFSKTYVNQDLKIQKFLKGIQTLKHDIIFLQQTSSQLLNAFKSEDFAYQVFDSKTEKKDCLILVRKQKFKTFKGIDQFLSNQNQAVQQLLQWNSDIVIAVVDNFILISGHLSSKPEKNKPQVQKMNNCLQILYSIYPQHIIVVGCDVNSQYSFPPKPFKYYPNSKLDYTNVKRRTFMQAQFHKAQQIVQNCVDYLISSVPMKNTKVIDLNGEQKNRMNITYIPSDNHPFDHFIVSGIINLVEAEKQKQKLSSKKKINLKPQQIGSKIQMKK